MINKRDFTVKTHKWVWCNQCLFNTKGDTCLSADGRHKFYCDCTSFTYGIFDTKKRNNLIILFM